VRATGLPTLSAVSKFSLSTPQAPPWPEQRSITSIGVSGIRRSISAPFGPMFCARAWQARWMATPPASGCSPSARPCFFAISTTYSATSYVASDKRFTSAFSGSISGHSNFSISAQEGTSATMS
jgi:hypothetical protein